MVVVEDIYSVNVLSGFSVGITLIVQLISLVFHGLIKTIDVKVYGKCLSLSGFNASFISITLILLTFIT